MSDRDLDRKFSNLAQGVIDDRASTELLAQCWKLGELADSGAIGRGAA